MKRCWYLAVAVAVVALAAGAAAQGRVVLRMATLVPDGSVWDKHLKQMASEWNKLTGGRVSVTVYPSGALGDEREIVRRMALGSPQAAALTVVGLAEVDPAFNVFSIPFFFDSYEELYHVIDRMTPMLSQRLDQKNLVLIAWGHGGWAQVFTTRPVRTLNDLKQIKLFTSAGDERMVQWYKSNGFQPRALAMTDILTGLTSGMIEGLPAPPTAANAFQWFRQTKYMLDIGIAPVVGAVVVAKKSWLAIPDADRPKLLEAAKRMETRLEAEIPKQDAASIDEMKKRGLVVTKAEGPEWREAAQAFAATMRGALVPADVYDMAVRERDAFRQRKPASR
ncbi:MAG TPA: TRAP transporter substrate-binding protein DctP [Vicinamibacterales bacterium]|nr:TRAP transporter substrate-binding protein DctP [Vicinamibacterales bacterium]